MRLPSPRPQGSSVVSNTVVSKSTIRGAIPLCPANIFSRRCPASIQEQFEFITKRIDAETQEIVGVKCRLCDEVIMDEMTARQCFGAGATIYRGDLPPVIGGAMFLAVPLLLWGGMHMLTCKRTKMN